MTPAAFIWRGALVVLLVWAAFAGCLTIWSMFAQYGP